MNRADGNAGVHVLLWMRWVFCLLVGWSDRSFGGFLASLDRLLGRRIKSILAAKAGISCLKMLSCVWIFLEVSDLWTVFNVCFFFF